MPVLKEANYLNFISECEKNVLSILIYSGRKTSGLIFQSLVADYLIDERHRLLFQTIKHMIEHDEALSFYSINNTLIQTGILDKITSSYLEEIFQSYVSDIFLDPNLQALILFAQRQMLLHISQEIERELKKGTDYTVLCHTIIEKAEKIMGFDLNLDFPSFAQAVNAFQKRVELLATSPHQVIGLASGFNELDYLTKGFQKNDLIILAGRPGMGKTSFALNLLRNIARNNHGVAFISLEMSKESLIERLYGIDSGIPLYKFKTGQDLTPQNWVKINQITDNLASYPIYVDDIPGLSIQAIMNKMWHLFNSFPNDGQKPKVIIIDYLQLIKLDNSNYNSRQQEIAEISSQLKNLARSLKVPVICLSQLSRAVEKRALGSYDRDQENKQFKHIPILSDLRDSGAIEQDADLVVFLYRFDYYLKQQAGVNGVTSEQRLQQQPPEDLFIKISKHRSGPTGEVKVKFYLKSGHITN